MKNEKLNNTMNYLFGSSEPVKQETTEKEEEKIEYTRVIFPSEPLKDGYYDIVYWDGDWFVGYIENNTWKNGKLTTLDGDVYEGDFSNYDITYGRVFYKDLNMIEEGPFNTNTELNGSGKRIYSNQSIFTGEFINGYSMEEAGEFTLPENLTMIHKKQTGIVTHEKNNFVVTFEKGPISKIVTRDIDLIDMRFLDYCDLTYTFRDGCVLIDPATKSEPDYENDIEDPNPDFEPKDKEFILSRYPKYNEWETYQLVNWLEYNPKLKHLDEDFFYMIKKNKVTLEQLKKFTDDVYWEYELDKTEILQVRTELEKIV